MQDQSTLCSGIDVNLHQHLFQVQSKKRLADLQRAKVPDSLAEADCATRTCLPRNQVRCTSQAWDTPEQQSVSDPRAAGWTGLDSPSLAICRNLPQVKQEDSSREMDQCDYNLRPAVSRKSGSRNRLADATTYLEVPLYSDKTEESRLGQTRIWRSGVVANTGQKRELQPLWTKGILRKQSVPTGPDQQGTSHLKRVSFDRKKRVIEVPYEPRAQERRKTPSRVAAAAYLATKAPGLRSGTLQY